MTEFEQIYREHFDTVYRFLIRLCRNEPLAEELAQETFFRAMRSLGKFDGRCRVDVWLCQIAKNAYYSHYRKQKDTSTMVYGITVTGTPVSGDQITVVYTAEDRGTIIQSDPQSLVSVGANLFDPEAGYAIGLKYSNLYGFAIRGTYTAVKYSATIDGTKTTLSPADGLFDIPANGYIFVEGSSTDTMVFMTWSDWILSMDWPEYEDYSADEIDLSTVMETYFPYGLLRVGDIRDEIDFNTGMAISNVERLSYSAENLATAKASGRTWEADTNYIYLERASAVTHDIDLDGQLAVSDHGLKYFTDTDVSVYAIVIYGNNLKNKLERDVLTKSQDVVNGFDSDATDKALSAAAGKTLNDHLAQFNLIKFGTLTGTGNPTYGIIRSNLTADIFILVAYVDNKTVYTRFSTDWANWMFYSDELKNQTVTVKYAYIEHSYTNP